MPNYFPTVEDIQIAWGKIYYFLSTSFFHFALGLSWLSSPPILNLFVKLLLKYQPIKLIGWRWKLYHFHWNLNFHEVSWKPKEDEMACPKVEHFEQVFSCAFLLQLGGFSQSYVFYKWRHIACNCQ